MIKLFKIALLTTWFAAGLLAFVSPGAFAATLPVSPALSKEFWKISQKMQITEELDLIQVGEKNWFEFDSISCVFEQYNACSFFARIHNERRLVVNLDEAAEWMRLFAKAGIFVDEDNARMDIEKISCAQSSQETICELVSYPFD